MRIDLLLRTGLCGCVVLLGFGPVTALARDNRGDDFRPPRNSAEHPDVYQTGRAHAEWLAECRRRAEQLTGANDVSHEGGRRDSCEAYLDDVYARSAHGHPASAPLVMVPIKLTPSAESDCAETIEYVYEDVPARARPRRAAPRDKRIRATPDKRIPAS